MKKRTLVYFLVFTLSIFYFSIPNIVLGQILAQQVYNKNKKLLQSEDIRSLLPNALRIFGKTEIQSALTHGVIEVILDGPLFLRSVDPEFDDQFIALLTINDDLRALFRNEQFYNVLKSHSEIGELADLIEGTPTPTSLEIVSGDNQHGMSDMPLPQPFVVEVRDQHSDPFVGASVTFSVTVGDGELPPTSARTTDLRGEARTTLTLGSDPGIYQVEAKVVGFPSLTQTFTAAATGVSEDRSDIAPEKVTISEIMFASNENKLPQWIELNNSSNTAEVDLEGWTLEIHGISELPESNERKVEDMAGGTLEIITTLNLLLQNQQYARFTFPKRFIEPQETLLIASSSSVRGRNKSTLPAEQVYVLDILKPLYEQAFYLKLRNKTGEQVDEVGNFNILTNTSDWSLPKSVTEDDTPSRRASMIRRHDDDGAPLPGTEERAWISAMKTRLADKSTAYYGDRSDIGAPGIKSGGTDALPVQLSSFRAERTDAGVAITWSTESELDNAGFTIRRSKMQNGVFWSIHARLILGAGTTGEKNDYTLMDTTAEPGVIYYYQIEDISFGGVRRTLATTRLRGDFSAKSKFTTTWGSLKGQY